MVHIIPIANWNLPLSKKTKFCHIIVGGHVYYWPHLGIIFVHVFDYFLIAYTSVVMLNHII